MTDATVEVARPPARLPRRPVIEHPVVRVVVPWVGVALALLLWEYAANSIDNRIFPPFSKVVGSLGDFFEDGGFSDVLRPTLSRFAVAFSASAVFGVGIGLVLGRVPVLRTMFIPVVDFARAVPATLLVPAALAILGIGSTMIVWVVIASATWPIAINTIDGVRRVDPLTLDAARSLGFRRLRLVPIILRASLHDLMAGLRVGLSVSLAVLIVAELIGSTSGLGYYIRTSQQTFRVVETYAGVVLLACIGWLLDTLFITIERAVLGPRYRQGARR